MQPGYTAFNYPIFQPLLNLSIRQAARLLLLAWLLSKLVCYPLWLGTRDFPLAPVSDILLTVPGFVHNIIFFISIGCMALACFKSNKNWLIILLLLELLSCLLDQHRWQPWQYQFMFMLSAILYFKKEEDGWFSWQLIFVSIYFFSGLSKLQPGFIHDVWQQLILRGQLGIYSSNEWLLRMGYLLPLIEMGAALCICMAAFRKWAVLLLLAMHILILFVFAAPGPHGFNSIWLWNVLMCVLLVPLFVSRSIAYPQRYIRRPFAWLLLACFMVLPWLQLQGNWDRYLSFSLYSGALPQLYICVEATEELPEDIPVTGPANKARIPCTYYINTLQWAAADMNCFPYPEDRVFKIIARNFVARYPGARARFYVYKAGFKKEWRELGIK